MYEKKAMSVHSERRSRRHTRQGYHRQSYRTPGTAFASAGQPFSLGAAPRGKLEFAPAVSLKPAALLTCASQQGVRQSGRIHSLTPS